MDPIKLIKRGLGTMSQSLARGKGQGWAFLADFAHRNVGRNSASGFEVIGSSLW